MPIDRSRYAENWDAITLAVKTDADWHCEHCDRPCLKPGEDWLAFVLRLNWSLSETALLDYEHPVRHVLTTAHLNQDPSDNSRTNLRALCAPCHLKHDRPFRQANAFAKRERRGQLTVFALAQPEPAGHGLDDTRVQLPLPLTLELES